MQALAHRMNPDMPVQCMDPLWAKRRVEHLMGVPRKELNGKSINQLGLDAENKKAVIYLGE
jgi:hypothetical protein